MGLNRILSLCVLLIAVWVENKAEAFRVTRQGNGLIVELLIVVDYSAFNKWYMLTSTSSTHTHRVQEATDKVKQYLSALIHSTNNVYRSLQAHNLNIQIKLVDILVMTSASQSPWTETLKVLDADGVNYDVDPTKVLPMFIPKSVELQKTIPHDHAMIFTKFSMKKSSGSTFSGYANIEAECDRRSVSIVEDNDDIYTAQLMAHEIGHSLGCDHDGEGNSHACPSGQGYAMEAHFILANDKKWTFSTCSVAAINSYIQYLNTHHKNCLTHIDNTHPDSQVITEAHEWYGQVYSWDEQCRINYGPQSYLCRRQYDGDYTTACLKMYCYSPEKDSCRYVDGGDGSPCATGKWCMSNQCVHTTASHIQSITGTCVAGDQPGVAYHNRTCHQIGTSHDIDCQIEKVQSLCCETCAAILKAQPTLSPTDIDGQCVRKHGPGSYLCRGASAYDGKTLSDVVCSNVQCHDTTRNNWCLSTVADDLTSCGFRKWCKNGVCVHDSSAPAVPDDCPWGDQPGVAAHGLTCDQVRQPENHYRCYDTYTSTKCCAACNSVLRNVTGCEFGDTSSWCHTHIGTPDDRQMCYWGHNSDLCCESCIKYMTKNHVAGCEYGDRSSHCHADRCNTYDSAKLQQCCETCRGVAVVG